MRSGLRARALGRATRIGEVALTPLSLSLSVYPHHARPVRRQAACQTSRGGGGVPPRAAECGEEGRRRHGEGRSEPTTERRKEKKKMSFFFSFFFSRATSTGGGEKNYSPARQAVPGGFGVGPERPQQPTAASSHGPDAGAEERRGRRGRRPSPPLPALPSSFSSSSSVARVSEVAPDAATRGPGLVAASVSGPLLEHGEVAGLPAKVRDPWRFVLRVCLIFLFFERGAVSCFFSFPFRRTPTERFKTKTKKAPPPPHRPSTAAASSPPPAGTSPRTGPTASPGRCTRGSCRALCPNPRRGRPSRGRGGSRPRRRAIGSWRRRRAAR